MPGSRYADKDKDKEKEKDKEKDKSVVIFETFSTYEQNIGLLTPTIAAALDQMINDYSDAWVCDAINRATQAEHRSLSYVQGILRNWKRDGPNNASGPKHKKSDYPPGLPEDLIGDYAIIRDNPYKDNPSRINMRLDSLERLHAAGFMIEVTK